MKRKNDLIVYKNAEDFVRDMGLSEVDIALVKEKIKLIEKLKAKRIKKRLSQAALAKQIGSKQPAIARMESGLVGQVSMDFLIKVAMVLSVPYSMKSKLVA